MSLSLRLAAAMEIPEDILIEILVRLPADSLMRFKCVSRIWSSLISSRYFTNLFFKYSSLTNPKRHVFVHWDQSELFSSSLCNLDSTNSFLQLNPDLTLLGNRMQNGDYYRPLHFVNAMRGLMCFRDETAVRIINFTTRQSLILPQVESNILMKSDDGVMCTCGSMMGRSPSSFWSEKRRPYMWNYLGYDHVNDEYKVLSTISSVKKGKELRSETQVLVLGVGASWRNTKSLITSLGPHHIPYGKDITINGVLYYGVWSDHEKRSVLMSFDFSSEEFSLIELPMEYRIKWDKELCLVDLMNYQDQVAVLDDFRLTSESILDLWVLEDAGQSIWSLKPFSLPYHELRTMLDTHDFNIRGTSRNGEIALCEAYRYERKIKYITYDLERNHIKRVVGLETSYVQLGWLEINIWDDVESIMYLEA